MMVAEMDTTTTSEQAAREKHLRLARKKLRKYQRRSVEQSGVEAAVSSPSLTASPASEPSDTAPAPAPVPTPLSNGHGVGHETLPASRSVVPATPTTTTTHSTSNPITPYAATVAHGSGKSLGGSPAIVTANPGTTSELRHKFESLNGAPGPPPIKHHPRPLNALPNGGAVAPRGSLLEQANALKAQSAKPDGAALRANLAVKEQEVITLKKRVADLEHSHRKEVQEVASLREADRKRAAQLRNVQQQLLARQKTIEMLVEEKRELTEDVAAKAKALTHVNDRLASLEDDMGAQKQRSSELGQLKMDSAQQLNKELQEQVARGQGRVAQAVAATDSSKELIDELRAKLAAKAEEQNDASLANHAEELEELRAENARNNSRLGQLEHDRAQLQAETRQAINQARALQTENAQLKELVSGKTAEAEQGAQTQLALEQSFRQLQETVSVKEQELLALQDQVSETQDLKKQASHLEVANAALQESIKERSWELEAAKQHQLETQSRADELERLSSDQVLLVNKARADAETISRAVAQNQMLKKQVAELESKVVETSEKCLALTSTNQSIVHELAQAKEIVQGSTDAQSQLEQARARTDELEKHLQQQFKLTEEAKAEVEALRTQLTQAVNVQSELVTSDTLIEALATIEQQKAQLAQMVTQFEALKTKNADMDAFAAENERLTHELARAVEKEPQLIAAQAEVQTLRAELAQAMAARAHNDSDQHEIAKARETVHALRAELKQAMAAQAQQAADLQEAREEQQRLRSEVLERADDSEEDVEGLKEQLTDARSEIQRLVSELTQAEEAIVSKEANNDAQDASVGSHNSSGLSISLEDAAATEAALVARCQEQAERIAGLTEHLQRLSTDKTELSQRLQVAEQQAQKAPPPPLSRQASDLVNEELKALRKQNQELVSKLRREELLNNQLALETETIGEYISLYHEQREVLNGRVKEKDEFIRRMMETKVALEEACQHYQAEIVQLKDAVSQITPTSAPRALPQLVLQQQQQPVTPASGPVSTPDPHSARTFSPLTPASANHSSSSPVPRPDPTVEDLFELHRRMRVEHGAIILKRCSQCTSPEILL